LAASRGPGAAMPTTLPAIDPVVLVLRAHPFDDSEWLFEPKYDGFRGFLYASASGCDIRSAWDHRFDGYAELCDRVAGVIGRREVILDGEIVSLDPKEAGLPRAAEGTRLPGVRRVRPPLARRARLPLGAAERAEAASRGAAPGGHRPALQGLHARGARARPVRGDEEAGSGGDRREAQERPVRSGDPLVQDQESRVPPERGLDGRGAGAHAGAERGARRGREVAPCAASGIPGRSASPSPRSRAWSPRVRCWCSGRWSGLTSAPTSTP
jgi:hypothetical protein